MDTKLKNNRNTRIIIVIIGLIVSAFATICFFPGISRRAQVDIARQEAEAEENPEVDTEILREIYEGCYVLYYETAQREGAQTPTDVYLELPEKQMTEEERIHADELEQWMNDIVTNTADDFEMYRSKIDYAISLGAGEYEKNTSQPLEKAFLDKADMSKEQKARLQEYYSSYFVMEFDENGLLHLGTVYGGYASADTLIKTLGQIDRENPVWSDLETMYQEYGLDGKVKKPANFAVAFGIPESGIYQLASYDNVWSHNYWMALHAYSDAGAGLLYGGMLALITGLMFLVTSKRVWKTEISMNRPGRWYLMEAAVTGVICVLCLGDSFVQLIYSMSVSYDLQNLWNILVQSAEPSAWGNYLEVAVYILLLYAGWYLSVRFLRPVFSLGVWEYIRQYSLIYQIFPLLKRGWKRICGWVEKHWMRFTEEIGHVDFSQKSMKTLVKVVVVNFVVLSVISCLWFFGIGVLLLYSVALFFFMKKYYDRIGRDYQILLRGVNQIAEGNLDAEIAEDIGVFEPFKDELARIRYGFKKAVNEEVKSQRMKTELITNVSHDLKTPLTAITTYVELLKKEDITEEERHSYIETLEKKSLRLKVLIEDLFEVSKATSNNITLNLMEVDVVNLLKQVAIEHTDAYEAVGLELRWRLPEEKVVLMLDNQKTYRIFENLFLNVQKYAMENSRVYVDVEVQPEGAVRITIRNMSREELNFRADEITERFVRGDASRNTEGSGLGLAIAKSFTEAQGGKFGIEVDGDLFKAVLQFTK